jgi:hypothetical protein
MNITNSGTINIPGVKGSNDRQVLYQLTTAEEADEKKDLNTKLSRTQCSTKVKKFYDELVSPCHIF